MAILPMDRGIIERAWGLCKKDDAKRMHVPINCSFSPSIIIPTAGQCRAGPCVKADASKSHKVNSSAAVSSRVEPAC